VAEALGLEEAIANSDLVLTGEGRYDAQTKHGKTVSEVFIELLIIVLFIIYHLFR
jgi:glycerate kinase